MTRTPASTGRRRLPAGVRGLLGTLLALGLGLAALGVVVTGWGVGSASEFWSADSIRPGSGAARLSSVEQVQTPQVTAEQSSLAVEWDAARLGDGGAVDGYRVQRYDQDGVARTVGAGCAGRVSGTSCTETDVPEGVWTYTVTALFATSWSGPESEPSAPVRVDQTPPGISISQQVDAGRSIQRQDTIYYRGAAAGSFRLVTAVSDAGSGPASASTGGLNGTPTGWSHSPSDVVTPAGGPYVSASFSWGAGTTSATGVTVVAFDRAGNQSARELTFRDDSAGPTGGQVSHTTGALPAGTKTLTISLATVNDAGVGVASRVLQTSAAPLSGRACQTFGPWVDAAEDPGATVTIPVERGKCYRSRYVLTDLFGNQTVVAGPGAVGVLTYQTTVQETGGLVSYWRLDDTSGTQIAATNGAAGTYAGGPAQRQAGAISGDPSTSVFFDGTDDFGRVARPISNAFSIEFWFRSTQGIGNGTQWYQGAGLVDAESAGPVNDFGVTLAADGRVMAGTGNQDRTVQSAAGYNDGKWHHVVFTRSGGTLRLYVDGEQRASRADGTTAALTASANIDFGRVQTGINYYRGNLDEIALYGSALPAATVRQHYVTGQP